MSAAAVLEALPLGDAADKLAATEIGVTAGDAQFMDDVVASVHRAVATPLFQRSVFSSAPAIARDAPQRVHGLFSGFDFHLTPEGPRLIEINTNAGGAFYGALIDEMRWRAGERDAKPFAFWSHLFVQHVREEWDAAGRGALRTVAIVDDEPDAQFLGLEFQLAARALQDAGISAFVADPRALTFRDGRLWRDGTQVDLVYNRLTRFALDGDPDRALRDALLAGAAVVTPDPRLHALIACKRNLALLGDDAFLREAGVDPSSHGVLLRAIPRTELVTPESVARLQRERARHYFKPFAGFGSRAVYDGGKLTAKTWREVIAPGGYVAQQRIEPGRVDVPEAPGMRFDVRDAVHAACARLSRADDQFQDAARRLCAGARARGFDMTKWVPEKADAARVTRARKAQALRSERRGKVAIKLEASRRADEGIDAVRRELNQTTQSASGKRQ